ncbi:holo-ACP synthase [Cetobacterium sp.]|uniref:holo-ACP synthase n=1 Tax=Cetobacterium sp. TaxID=2071632 RepID=UPI002FCA9412
MKVLGIGNDIVEISRIEKALSKKGFKERVFTIEEITQLDKKGGKIESYAGRFSAKEAISKALGTGVRGFNLIDIEILNDDLGKPVVKFLGALKERGNKLDIQLSISHCKEYATAVAIIIEI